MHGIKKKHIFITSVILMVISGIVGCGKVDVTADGDAAGNFAVEAENLPIPEEVDKEQQPKTEDTDVQEPAQENKESGSDSSENGKTFHYINEGKDLYGDIYEVGDMQFTVTEVYRETFDDGAEIMAASAEGAEDGASKITVVYDESTKFIKQKIWDAGANHEEREGTAADLKKGFTAEMNGNYEGDVFHAAEILIVEVILD
ncbi:MAG: hypothetical protein HDQ96_05055 [Lachnospiraceae bacterium]|nr:hypothetical protein [Lachnospiraceae bacterium]